MHQFAKHLQTHLGATWQFRWYAVAAAWLVGVAGWAAVAMIPDRYQASARVYVDTQSILRPLLAGLAMQPNVGQIVEMMSRTLISRPNVEKVIEMSNIKFDPRSTRGEEQTVDRLMRELSIKGTGAQNFYAITYADKNPQQARQVVQSLLGMFEGSLGDKRKDSDSARTFIDDQLKTYGERLATAENALTEFKRRNLGMMPAQTQNFDVRMSEARTALNEARLELAEAEQGRDAIKARFSGESPPSLLDERLAADGSRADDPNPEIDARIAALQQKLDTLRLSYTDRHPDIVAIPSMIEQLKAQKRKEAEQRQHEREARLRNLPPGKSSAFKSQDPVNQQLSIALAEYEANVAALRARVSEYQSRYNELRASATAMPRVETEFSQRTRDYEAAKRSYDQLVARRESAQLTGDMQSNPGVMDFRVIDPPQVSAIPDWPNRPLLITLVLFVSLAAGVGVAFVISQIRPRINSELDLQKFSGLTVYGTVAMAWTDDQRRRRKIGLMVFGTCLLGLLSVYVAMMAVPVAQRLASVQLIAPQ